jgi:hypothetical protein
MFDDFDLGGIEELDECVNTANFFDNRNELDRDFEDEDDDFERWTEEDASFYGDSHREFYQEDGDEFYDDADDPFYNDYQD